MKKKILIAISIIATITLGTITGCTAYESSSHQEVISDTSISSENEPTSSEDSSSEYIIDSSEDESSETDSSENDSSETDSSEDESSEVEKVTTKTPKKVEDSSSEDDNSSKVTTTKKTETPKTTTTTKTTQAPVTQKPATTTKTTTKKTTTHTHRWVKQWDDGNGTIFYWCPECFAEKYDHYTVTTTTKVQPASKTIQPSEWIPVYSKTLVTHTVGDGYEKIIDANGYAKPGKKVEFVSKTYWNEAAANRGDATEIAKRTKAQNEAKAFIDRDDLMNAGWVSSGNDHYIDVPDKHNIVFYYYKDSNGKYAIWVNNSLNGVVTKESDLSSYGCYDYSILGTNNLTSKYVYFTGTPWAGKF